MALKRELGTAGVFAMAAGAMISSGLFVLPAIVYPLVGPALFLSYLIAAVALLPSLLSKAELMTAMPKAGGTYYHVDRSMGPTVGMIGGVANWASLAFKGAFALIGIGAFVAYLLPVQAALTEWEIRGVAILFCLIFALVNMFGTRHAGRLQGVLVAALLLAVAGYAVWGGVETDRAAFGELFPHGMDAVLVGVAMVFISFGGVTQIANLAEEVRDPSRNLVRGMFLAYGIVSVLYVVVCVVTVGVLPAAAEQWSIAPLSQAAQIFAGLGGAVVMGLAALCAYMTTGNAGILTASRALMAMSDDDLVPEAMGRVGERKTPVNAILFTASFMAVSIVLLPLVLFVKAASAMLILLLIFECLSVIIMRESRIPTYRPTWRSPLYPWVQIAGIVCYGFMLVELGSLPLAIAGVILGAAILWYALYARVRVMRESALVRLAERLAAVDFQDHDLEAELSAIVRERDQRDKDRFDRIIEDCPVLDLAAPASRSELFHALADNLAPGSAMSSEVLYAKLRDREELSSTVVRPGLAVPHIITQEVEGFHMVLARVRGVVSFHEGEAPVHAVFAVATCPAEHDFYLQVLVAVSEITQEADFDPRWLRARTSEALREVVLAADRPREAE